MGASACGRDNPSCWRPLQGAENSSPGCAGVQGALGASRHWGQETRCGLTGQAWEPAPCWPAGLSLHSPERGEGASRVPAQTKRPGDRLRAKRPSHLPPDVTEASPPPAAVDTGPGPFLPGHDPCVCKGQEGRARGCATRVCVGLSVRGRGAPPKPASSRRFHTRVACSRSMHGPAPFRVTPTPGTVLSTRLTLEPPPPPHPAPGPLRVTPSCGHNGPGVQGRLDGPREAAAEAL